ncbi:MAG: hypothetical protein KC656_23800, partial [Myxococcales bacterium]|nr:hypothetical protein [Myxococcales bacterium]
MADSGREDALAEPARAVRELGAEVVFGPQGASLLGGIDVVLASPAIPFEHALLLEAARRGLPVTTETNFVLARVQAPVLGITGTKGKSTTTALVTAMLRAAGRRVHQGGNIGHPLVAELGHIAADDLVVLELSSFQLWWTRRIQRSPNVTLVTNLFPEHLDRHGRLEHYARAKRAALDFQRPDDVAVLPADDAAVREADWLTAGQGRRLLWGTGGNVVLDGDEVETFGTDPLDPSDDVSTSVDSDGDGHGHGGLDVISACEAPRGYVESSDDCDDEDPDFHPGAVEDDCTDPNDYDCDGLVAFADDDQDGVAACEDCDDQAPGVYPGATEVCN